MKNHTIIMNACLTALLLAAGSVSAAVIFSDNLNTGGGHIADQGAATFAHIPLNWTLGTNGTGNLSTYADWGYPGGTDKLWNFYNNAANGSNLYTDAVAVSLTQGETLAWTMDTGAYNYGGADAQQGVVYLEYLNASLTQVAYNSQTYGLTLSNAGMSGVFTHDFMVSDAARAGAVFVRLTVAKNSGSNSAQMFDNITLNQVPVPEPASLALLVLGATLFMRRRRS